MYLDSAHVHVKSIEGGEGNMLTAISLYIIKEGIVLQTIYLKSTMSRSTPSPHVIESVLMKRKVDLLTTRPKRIKA